MCPPCRAPFAHLPKSRCQTFQVFDTIFRRFTTRITLSSFVPGYFFILDHVHTDLIFYIFCSKLLLHSWPSSYSYFSLVFFSFLFLGLFVLGHIHTDVFFNSRLFLHSRLWSYWYVYITSNSLKILTTEKAHGCIIWLFNCMFEIKTCTSILARNSIVPLLVTESSVLPWPWPNHLQYLFENSHVH